jgi:hypothetical protein
MSIEFDLRAVYSALDVARHERGLTWTAVAREINARFKDSAVRPISASTITGLRTKRVVEGDGVLQMLLWLGRSPESFLPNRNGHSAPNERLPQIPSTQILRFDAQKIHAALDAQRVDRGLSWREVADAIGGVSVPSLTRLANGGRVSFPDVMRIVGWLERPVAAFTRGSSV